MISMNVSPPIPFPDLAVPPAALLPPLENGDRLARVEFLRRAEAMPQLKKVELIEGVVYMPPPVSFDSHGSPHADLICWLGTYRSATPGVAVADNSTTLLDLKNVPQPDAALIIRSEFGGRTRIEDGYISGGPELVAEIASSSVSLDATTKLEVYRRNGVQEYVLWRVRDREIDWFELVGGDYRRKEVAADGIVRSTIFPGLWLHPDGIIAGDLSGVLEILRRGLATQEHDAFLKQLGRQRHPD